MATGDRPRREEFVRLLEEHRDALYRFAMTILWDKNGAEDAVQDAAIAAYRGFDGFLLGTNFKAWIFRYLVNTVLNLNRKAKRSLEVGLSEAEEAGLASPERAEVYHELLRDPAAWLEQVSDPVRRAVLDLTPAQRIVFLLRSVEGFSYKEIAAMVGAPIGTVMSHLSRARGTLRERLADYVTEAGSPKRRQV